MINHSTYGAENLLDWIVIVISSVFFEYKMITDSQIFTALMIALTAAILAIGLGRQLYV